MKKIFKVFNYPYFVKQSKYSPDIFLIFNCENGKCYIANTLGLEFFLKGGRKNEENRSVIGKSRF